MSQPNAFWYESDFGVIWLSRWLGEWADNLPTRKDGQIDRRSVKAKRFFRRMEKLAQARYNAGLDVSTGEPMMRLRA